jgi:two-component system sensor histidine kinase YesM
MIRLVLIMVGICFLVSLWLSFTVSRPVSFLIRQIRKISNGSFDVDFTIDAQNEITDLAQGLMQMEVRIAELIEKVTRVESQKRNSELVAIQAQINPHFLYNTLGSARQLVEMGDMGRAETMLDALILFFRTGLSQGRPIVSLSEELSHVSSYLEIQKMRYKDDFRYEIQVEKGAEQGSMVKLSIQPLVENSIYHGLKGRNAEGLILISAVRQEKDLIVRVFDNGYGIPSGHLEKLQQEICWDYNGDGTGESNFGLRNINQRIFLCYGTGYGLEIESVEGEFTQVTLRLPFVSFEEARKWQ